MMHKLMIRSGILFGIIGAMSCHDNLYSRQLPPYSEYMFNTIAINPAYAGHRNAIQTSSMFRKQWTGYKTSPQSSFFSIDMPILSTNIGLGVKITDEREVAAKTFGVQSVYSYKIHLTERSILALGLQAGILSYKYDFTDVDVIDANDPAFSYTTNSLELVYGTGAFFTTEKFYIGLSIPNLIQDNITKDRAESLGATTTKQPLHLYFNTGFVFSWNNGVVIKPSVLLRATERSPVSFDANVNLWLDEVLGFGISYRKQSAIVGMVDVKVLPNLRLGYAYDQNISPLKLITKGSHELFLKYEIPLNSGLVSPRYF